MHFYVNEPEDPLIQGWMQLFPDLFESRDAMPAVLQGHLRVPEELFNVQVHQLQRYHVTDPRSFYSGDDIWEVPMETYGREQVPVVPYHVTAQVEDNESSEFLLLQPLTPHARISTPGSPPVTTAITMENCCRWNFHGTDPFLVLSKFKH